MEYCNYNQLAYYLDKQGISNNTAFIRWLKDIINVKLGLFMYDNLPNGLDSQIIENALLFNNFLCFYNDVNLGGLILCRYVCDSAYNMYWLPKRVNLLTLSGVTIKNNVPYEDIIPCRDNALDIIPFITLNGWVDKIIEIEKTIDSNIRIARFPLILKGTKQESAQLKQLIKKMYQCESIVIASSDIANRLESNDIKLSITIDTLYNLLSNYKNQALASIGIYGIVNKKERLVTEEMNSQQEYIDFVYQEMVEQRNDFINKINSKWGYNIKLKELYGINIDIGIENKVKEEEALQGVQDND